MADDRKDESGRESEVVVPTSADTNVAKPTPEGPQEVADAAAQEAEYPEDQTDEG